MTGTLLQRIRPQRSSSPLLRAGAMLLVPGMLLAPSVAESNDSVGHLAAGGLILGRTDAIEMRREDLYVSAKEIRVQYQFYNKTDDGVRTIVAFPMPEIPTPSDVNNVVVPSPEQDPNYFDFETRVRGAPVAMKVEQKAFALGIDRTSMLLALGLPVSPLTKGLPEALAALAPRSLDELRAAGLVSSELYDVGKGMTRHFHPQWTVRTTHYWTETFAPKREVVITHRYKPSVGGSAQTFVGSDFATENMLKDYRDRYCLTEGFIDAARRLQRRRNGNGAVIVTEQRLEYILKTGANWAGAIQNFRLTVDKESQRNLVSFCMTGVRKVSPTQFLVEKKDYFPERNLEVLILKPLEAR